ncbi:MAG TPA: TonB-dependent receptor plug domain-containing protein [Gemmatimonadaceae bacterium]|nr:TonB-dependent receptor plug domain-containing protein [Gemmatimonadaceae bacterium]
MSGNHQYPRALVAITTIPISILLACASGGSKNTSGPPSAMGDTSSFDVGEGKSIEAFFAGRFPGVVVTANADGGLKIRIRGGSNSFFGSEEPLFVVDDTPVQAGAGGLIMLDPYDIQKIEVLKNPADIGLYGVRGANGVIKITLKKPGRH